MQKKRAAHLTKQVITTNQMPQCKLFTISIVGAMMRAFLRTHEEKQQKDAIKSSTSCLTSRLHCATFTKFTQTRSSSEISSITRVQYLLVCSAQIPSVINDPVFSPKDGGYCRGSASPQMRPQWLATQCTIEQQRKIEEIEQWDTSTALRWLSIPRRRTAG